MHTIWVIYGRMEVDHNEQSALYYPSRFTITERLPYPPPHNPKWIGFWVDPTASLLVTRIKPQLLGNPADSLFITLTILSQTLDENPENLKYVHVSSSECRTKSHQKHSLQILGKCGNVQTAFTQIKSRINLGDNFKSLSSKPLVLPSKM